MESKNIKIIKMYRFARYVREFMKNSFVNFTEADIEDWYNKLKIFTNVSKQLKAVYISEVMKKNNK